MSEDQELIREGITEVMCNGIIDFEILAEKFRWNLDDTMKLFRYSQENFHDLENDGLLRTYQAKIELDLPGKLLSRVVAMRLDPMEKRKGKGFSKTI